MSMCGLEKSIDDLNKDASSAQQMITLKDVEEGAVALRQVGESLAGLKAEFPTLQNKMRAVLRVEVEAVKFLKEEPHKLESLLKRVKSMTEILTGLRRLVTEDFLRGPESTHPMQKSTSANTIAVTESEMSKDSPLQIQEHAAILLANLPQNPPGAFHEVQNSLVKSESHMVVHHVQSSPVLIHQSHHSSALVHPTQNPLVNAKQSQNASVHQVPTSPVMMKRPHELTDGIPQIQSAPSHQFQSSSSTPQATPGQNLFIDEIHAASTKKGIHRKMTIEAAEREWEEKRQNMNQYDEKEFERLLVEAQANMMKGIPSLEVEPEQKPTAKPEESDGVKQLEEVTLPEPGNEKPMKSPPPPPPPRRFYPPGSGLTTTRSGEVIFTARKEGSPVTSEENSPVLVKSPRSPMEMKEMASTSVPVAASAVKEDEDEGDRIMAELQAFQKCSVMDVSSKTVVEQPKVEMQARDVRSTALLSAKEKKSSNLMSPTSRMPVSVGSKVRQQQGNTEKVTKQKLQDPQRQFRQANGSAKKAGGEIKVTSPTLPASKIPALSSSSGKNSSMPGPINDNTNHPSTSSKYPLSATNVLTPTAGRNVQLPPVSHIPSTSNGSLKLHAQSSALTGRGQPLSFPLHTPNGRPSSSPSCPSPVSPTSLIQGAKSIRTIHTASFASYKQQNANQGKFAMTTVKETA
ncbi:hypothetical protein scyTo_0003357 [Scyliorhinus torazame]|uniref:Sickle tail protein homolog n=1 Tax=Scyliorhinus torazame TaxID=75743 RepID=A0A401PMD2_SCYTO|nr:hypothetical protein [Scyliorhinus torazame]